MPRRRGLDRKARTAVDMSVAGIRAAYAGTPGRLVRIVLYGSRARGDARPDSDCDLAVVLAGDVDMQAERRAMSRAAYDALLATGIDVQAIPVAASAWDDPLSHVNPLLVQAMRRDGIVRWEAGPGPSTGNPGPGPAPDAAPV